MAPRVNLQINKSAEKADARAPTVGGSSDKRGTYQAKRFLPRLDLSEANKFGQERPGGGEGGEIV